MESRWQSIAPVLDEFQTFLCPGLPRFELVAADDSQWSDDRYKAQRATGVFSRRGVYLIFDQSEALQYVGVAMYTFQKRIWSHDEWVRRRWTDVIPFPDESYFLARALEFFLIVRLRPPANTQYRDYDIPWRDPE